jgi:hypothetical protein
MWLPENTENGSGRGKPNADFQNFSQVPFARAEYRKADFRCTAEYTHFGLLVVICAFAMPLQK